MIVNCPKDLLTYLHTFLPFSERSTFAECSRQMRAVFLQSRLNDYNVHKTESKLLSRLVHIPPGVLSSEIHWTHVLSRVNLLIRLARHNVDPAEWSQMGLSAIVEERPLSSIASIVRAESKIAERRAENLIHFFHFMGSYARGVGATIIPEIRKVLDEWPPGLSARDKARCIRKWINDNSQIIDRIIWIGSEGESEWEYFSECRLVPKEGALFKKLSEGILYYLTETELHKNVELAHAVLNSEVFKSKVYFFRSQLVDEYLHLFQPIFSDGDPEIMDRYLTSFLREKGPYILNELFCSIVKKNLNRFPAGLNALVQSSCFCKITKECLAWFFKRVSYGDNSIDQRKACAMSQILINCSRFDEILVEDLAEALFYSAARRNNAEFQAIVHSRRFVELYSVNMQKVFESEFSRLDDEKLYDAVIRAAERTQTLDLVQPLHNAW